MEMSRQGDIARLAETSKEEEEEDDDTTFHWRTVNLTLVTKYLLITVNQFRAGSAATCYKGIRGHAFP